MKTNNFFKVMLMTTVSLMALTFTSCSDDDDDEPTNALKLSPVRVDVAPNASQTVTIGGGTAPYTVTSSNEKVATASLKDKTITITGVAEGNVFVRVTDKSNLTGQIVVSVKEPLAVDKASVEVGVGKTADVTVSKGTAPYTAKSSNTSVATATVKDSKVTIKGIKTGSTKIIVTDKNKKTAVISVTVK